MRRLKARLNTPRNFLCCIGTSATLGGDAAQATLRQYATIALHIHPAHAAVGRRSIAPVDGVAKGFNRCAIGIQQIIKPETRSIADLYSEVRARTLEIVAPLEIEDYVVQTAEFMSPPRWHLGHTSWFFETVLQKYQAGYQTYSDEFLFYFNSYYEGFGARIERPRRGTRSRPTVKETVAYRAHIDEQMSRFIEQLSERDDADNRRECSATSWNSRL